MKPCKFAYKQVRDNSNEIFKGFGFRHLSDATQYYVHPNNQSYKGTTTLCQPIGESIMLMADFAASLVEGENFVGDIYYDDNISSVYIDIPVPEEWRTAGVTPAFSYRAFFENTESIKVGAYDGNGEYIVSNPVLFTESFKLMPVLMVLVSHLLLQSDEYCGRFMEFAEAPDAEGFVNIHEDFYQE